MISIGNVGHVLGMSSKKVFRWYREVLSGYKEAEKTGALHVHDLETYSKGEVHTIRVPILKPDNMGQHMNIDEKHIDGEYYTILSNLDTNKIALMAKTVKADTLYEIGRKFGDKCFVVSTIARDLAPNFAWLCRQLFMNAAHVADKFHIIRLLMDAVQSVRVRYRQDLLRMKRLAREAHKMSEQTRQAECHANGKAFRAEKFEYPEPVLSNGDTLGQLLVRSRGLLFVMQSDWTKSQSERAEVLFLQYPELKNAYNLACAFRRWMSKDQVGAPRDRKEEQLTAWIEKVRKTNIDELLSFCETLTSNTGPILNYFRFGRTNASAEALNSNIQRFINVNYGIRNSDFFLYRLEKYFA